MDFPHSFDKYNNGPSSRNVGNPSYYNNKNNDKTPQTQYSTSPIDPHKLTEAILNIIKVYNNASLKLPPTKVVMRTREEWGARPANWKLSYTCKIKYVFYTSTRTTSCWSVDTCRDKLIPKQKAQMENNMKMGDIIYNFMIGGDGDVYVGRGWYTRPDVPRQYRALCNNSLLIGLIGRYHHQQPSEAMMRSANQLVRDGVQLNLIEPKVLEFVMPP